MCRAPVEFRMNSPAAKMAPHYGSRAEDLRLPQDPKWDTLFDSGFHCDRGGTVPLAMLVVFLEAKIALTFVQPAAHGRFAARFTAGMRPQSNLLG